MFSDLTLTPNREQTKPLWKTCPPFFFSASYHLSHHSTPRIDIDYLTPLSNMNYPTANVASCEKLTVTSNYTTWVGAAIGRRLLGGKDHLGG
jgi:hypothetical protein